MNTNTYFVFNCNVLALFTFYAVPSSGKYKCALVHCLLLLSYCDIPRHFSDDFKIMLSTCRSSGIWPDGGIVSAQIFPKVVPKSTHSSLSFKSDVFETAKKFNKYLGYFCKRICCSERSYNALSGHTGPLTVDKVVNIDKFHWINYYL